MKQAIVEDLYQWAKHEQVGSPNINHCLYFIFENSLSIINDMVRRDFGQYGWSLRFRPPSPTNIPLSHLRITCHLLHRIHTYIYWKLQKFYQIQFNFGKKKFIFNSCTFFFIYIWIWTQYFTNWSGHCHSSQRQLLHFFEWIISCTLLISS